jgi:hypothetical protein
MHGGRATLDLSANQAANSELNLPHLQPEYKLAVVLLVAEHNRVQLCKPYASSTTIVAAHTDASASPAA